MKRFIGIIVGVIFFLIYTGIGNIETSDVSIDSYIAHITINDAGDMRVVEEWNMDYHETMTVRFRDIVYDKYADGYPLYKEASNNASITETVVVVKFFRVGVDHSDNIQVG